MNTLGENNTAIYWGAFNPPTLWHQKVIEWILKDEKWTIDQIIFTPDGARPDKKFWVSLEEREEIIEIFYEELQNMFWAHVDISRHFLHGKNGSEINTFHINKYFEETLWVMPYQIFGSDVIPDMETWWNNPDRFAQERLKKIFLNRPWYDFSPKWLDNFILLDIPWLIEVSSTTLKQMLESKQAIDHLLTPEVHRHITENNISYNS